MLSVLVNLFLVWAHTRAYHAGSVSAVVLLLGLLALFDSDCEVGLLDCRVL